MFCASLGSLINNQDTSEDGSRAHFSITVTFLFCKPLSAFRLQVGSADISQCSPPPTLLAWAPSRLLLHRRASRFLIEKQ